MPEVVAVNTLVEGFAVDGQDVPVVAAEARHRDRHVGEPALEGECGAVVRGTNTNVRVAVLEGARGGCDPPVVPVASRWIMRHVFCPLFRASRRAPLGP